ncbi:hypothetical protein [Pontibaca salina]|uniref:hypothetical protein n=1 Tax=Pontibaca salina TaxID=2795731 RepID=UPI0038CD3674
MRADDARRIEEIDRQRFMHHEAARLMAYAFHDPGKMPEFKSIKAPEKKPKVSDEADQARVRGFFMGLAMRASAGG